MVFANELYELYFLKDILKVKLKLDQVIFQWRHVNMP